ncbi:hypothetical protein [Paraburkholderia unamae]|uniref:Uncharacterized protein n=1 Tax=Paraburkholderia unamae TaxID=219649 RepID=A0ABX5K656_9BURK|nr:hypothetical protein [Paraburkholderia unamae]PVX60084.1 hypothetical protein C7402_14734 [Paraburkholderia unamae]CAG9274573.1 hypothetical protein PUN4_880007 [Paraburkholderia unamae]
MGFDSDLVRFMAHSTQYLLGHLATDAAHEPKGETAMPPSPAARASGFELPHGFAGIEAEPLPA